VPNFIKIDQTVAEIWRFNGFFFKMVAVRHNGSVGHVLGHHLVVSIIVRNLAEIDAVDLIINMKLSIFCPFGWNMSIQAQSCFLGGFRPQNGEQYQRNLKKNTLTRVYVV